MDIKGRIYKNPPLQEVVAEFYFRVGKPDPTVPGIMYENVKERYPKKEITTAFTIQMHLMEYGIRQEIAPIFHRVKLTSEDGKTVLQVAPDFLSINRLSPYPSWKNFRKTVVKEISIFEKILGLRTYDRVSLKYINLFNLPIGQIGDYLTYYLNVPEPLQENFSSAMSLSEFKFPDNDILKLHVFSHQGKTFLILDYTCENLNHLDVEVDTILDKAHEIIKNTFENIITDKARKAFETEEQP